MIFVRPTKENEGQHNTVVNRLDKRQPWTSNAVAVNEAAIAVRLCFEL
jgi:hypothetical protein